MRNLLLSVILVALFATTAEAASILQVFQGGTGWGNITANTILLGNGSSALATTTAGTNGQALFLLNGIPKWATASSSLATPVTTANGGTGLSNPGGTSAGAFLQFNGSSGASAVGAGAAGQTIVSDGNNWGGGALNLASANAVTGTLPVGNGGTGATAFSAYPIVGGNGTAALSASSTLWVAGINATSTTASSTFKGVTLLNVNQTGSATSTFATGIDITTGTGCFAIAGTCLQTIVSSASAYKQAVRFASTTTLPANTYNNGSSGVGATLTGNSNAAFYLDGNTPSTGDRVLVKNESAGANNGIYTLTQLGSGILPYILTRATDYNSSADVFPGVANFTNGGTVNANTCWILTNTTAVTIGTTALTYADECGAGSFTGTYPIIVSGTTISTAFGTTTANSWSSLQTFQSGFIATASSTITAGNFTVATGGTSLQQASTTNLTVNGTLWLPNVTNGNILAEVNGGIGGVATSSLTLSAAFSNSGTTGAFVGGSNGTLSSIVEKSFTYATTTWSGTTTIPLFQAIIASTINGTRCKTYLAGDTPGGTLNVHIGKWTASTTMFNASSTNNFMAQTSNNSVAAGDSWYAEIGTPATSPVKINCTVKFTI